MSEEGDGSDHNDQDFVGEDQSQTDDMEASRVARYALYVNREKKPLKRANLKPVLDEFRDRHGRKEDSVSRAKKLLMETMGLTIVDGRRDLNEKPKPAAKQFVVRANKYPEQFDLPFSSQEKSEYGLLMFVFIIIFFKNENIEQSSLLQILTDNGFEEGGAFGIYQNLLAKWVREDYIRLTKVDDPVVGVKGKTMISYGERFFAEFGIEMIQDACKNLLDIETPEEIPQNIEQSNNNEVQEIENLEPDQNEKNNQNEQNNQNLQNLQDEQDMQSSPPKEKIKRLSKKKKSSK